MKGVFFYYFFNNCGCISPGIMEKDEIIVLKFQVNLNVFLW